MGLRDRALGLDSSSLSLQVLGTPTREQIREMNPNYTEFKFPQIKAHPWTKVGQGKELRQHGQDPHWRPTGLGTWLWSYGLGTGQ